MQMEFHFLLHEKKKKKKKKRISEWENLHFQNWFNRIHLVHKISMHKQQDACFFDSKIVIRTLDKPMHQKEEWVFLSIHHNLKQK